MIDINGWILKQLQNTNNIDTNLKKIIGEEDGNK